MCTHEPDIPDIAHKIYRSLPKKPSSELPTIINPRTLEYDPGEEWADGEFWWLTDEDNEQLYGLENGRSDNI